MCATVIGFLHQGNIYAGNIEFPAMVSTFHLGISLLVAISSLKVFGEERELFWRESGSGMNVLAFMLAKVLGNVFDLMLQCCMFSLGYFLIAQPAGHYATYLWPCIYATLAASSWGYFISSVVPPQNAMTGAVVAMLILCGILGNPSKIPNRVSDCQEPDISCEMKLSEIMVFPSITRWTVPMTMQSEIQLAEAQDKCVADNNKKLMDAYSYPALTTYHPITTLQWGWPLLVVSFLLHVACYIGLKFVNRSKQV
jgi:hypothetical protein